MTTLNFFKGFDNTLSFNCVDTHHIPVKDADFRSTQALNDLKSLLILSKGNTLDYRFPRKEAKIPGKFSNNLIKTQYKSLSQNKEHRIIKDSPTKPENLTGIYSEFLSEQKKKKKNEKKSPFSFRKNYSGFHFKGSSQNADEKEMSQMNFRKYLNFLDSEIHNNEISPKHLPNKSVASSTFRSSLRKKSNTFHKIPEIRQQVEKSDNKNEDSFQLPRVRTMNLRKSFVNESFISDKMTKIASKVMKNLTKLEKLNNFNKIKTYSELTKFINNNEFLTKVFFDSTGKVMNPKLNELYIAQSVIIQPPKFNRNPIENRIRFNYDGIKSLEKLSETIKEFCFNKKLIDMKAEEKGIIDSQRALKQLERNYFLTKRRSLEKNEVFKTTIEIPLNYNNQISKTIKEFEERHGRLDQIKEKRKFIGEKVDIMMQVLCENFANFNKKKIF